MKIKGIVQIQKLDRDTLEVKDTIIQENVITSLWRTYLPYQPTDTFGPNIILGSEDVPNAVDHAWIRNAVYGTVPIGATSPQWFSTTDPMYSQWVQRFQPPVSGTRLIYQVGLTSATSADIFGLSYVNAFVYLATPCSQNSTELLDVTYRVQWIPEATNVVGQSLSRADVGHVAYYLTFGGVTLFPRAAVSSPFPLKYLPSDGKYTRLHFINSTSGAAPAYEGFTGVTNTTWEMDVNTGGTVSSPTGAAQKYVQRTTAGVDAFIGRLIGAELYASSSNRLMSWKNITAPSGLSIQPIHSHAAATFSASAPTPFLDATPATGTGKIVGGGTWTNPDIPEQYIIKITAGGGVGAAAYQFWKRNTVGFNGNSYNPQHVQIMSTQVNLNNTTNPSPVYDTLSGTHGLFLPVMWYPAGYTAGSKRMRCAAINLHQIVTADNTGITLFDVANSDYVNLDATTSPPLPVSMVKQVSVDRDTSTVWVACADTGLWKVTGFGTIVEHITSTIHSVPSDKCYGVDIGRGGRVWAAFDGGLSVSQDGGVSWTNYNTLTLPTFSFTGVSDNNWNTINYIKADPDHTDDRIALIRDPDTTISQPTGIVWWSVTNPTAVGVTLATAYNSARATTIGIDVSDIGGLWVLGGYAGISGAYPSRLTYGANTVTTITTSVPHYFLFFLFTEDSTGQPLVGLVTADTSYTITTTLYNSTGVAVSTVITTPGRVSNYPVPPDYQMFNNQLYQTYAIHMGSGYILTYRYQSSNSTSTFAGHVYGTILDTPNTFVGPVNHIVWEKYGWNGTNWEKNHTGSKPTHLIASELIHGVTIRFEDGATGTSFIQDEYYTFGVANGILKDNSIAYTTSTSSQMYPSRISTDFSGNVRAYPSVGTVTWKTKSTSLTVNPDQSLVNTYPLRGYGLYALSNNRVFGDFSITGTITQGLDRLIQIGLTPRKGFVMRRESRWGDVTHGSDTSSEFAFNIKATTIEVLGFTTSSSASILAGGSVWTLTRAGNTLTLTIDGTVRGTTTTATHHSYIIRVLYGMSSVGAGTAAASHTVPPITVTSSGTGYYSSVGSSLNGTGVFDPNFIFVEPDTNHLQLSLNGVPVTVKLSNYTTAPAPGEVVLVASHGDLLFNAADNGKVVTGSFIYSTK